MPNTDEINDLQDRLAIERAKLQHLLKQHSIHGTSFVPYSIEHGITEARDEIRHIKAALHALDAPADDHSDDTPSHSTPPHIADDHSDDTPSHSTPPRINGFISPLIFTTLILVMTLLSITIYFSLRPSLINNPDTTLSTTSINISTPIARVDSRLSTTSISDSNPTTRADSRAIPTSMIPNPMNEPIFPTSNADMSTSTSPITIVSSFTTPGDRVSGLTWDGEYLWLSDSSASIFKAGTSGKLITSFLSPDATPQGLAWDGFNLWLFTGNYGTIYQIHHDGQNSKKLKSFKSPAEVFGGGITNDMEWDGTALWYANQFNVFRLDTSGNKLSSFTLPDNVIGLAWDGSDLWLATEKGEISIVDTQGTIKATFPSPFPSGDFELRGLVWVNGFLWACGGNYFDGESKVYKLDVSQAVSTISSR